MRTSARRGPGAAAARRHAEGQVVGGVAGAGDAFQDRADAVGIDAVALDHAHVVQHLVALAVDGMAEGLVTSSQ